ncbi:MAG: hypothetical protein K6F05_07900 [Succinivibrio sp.]|nr:hypothetical protein [Succinivibrio sp.]
MLVYLVSFVFFLLFVGALSLSLILKKRPLKSEDEATQAILEGMTCASCHGACSFAGGSEDHSSEKCKAEKLFIPSKKV